MDANKIIIAGCRDFHDYDRAKAALEKVLINGAAEIVSGGAKGADALGERYARENQIPIKRFLPDWQKYDKLAGPIRNKAMAEYADMAIIFWDGKSKGSKNMISEARRAKIKVRVFGV